MSLLSLHDGESFSLPGSVPPNDMVNSESVVAIWLDDSGVVIKYQLDEFTYAWMAEHLVA